MGCVGRIPCQLQIPAGKTVGKGATTAVKMAMEDVSKRTAKPHEPIIRLEIQAEGS